MQHTTDSCDDSFGIRAASAFSWVVGEPGTAAGVVRKYMPERAVLTVALAPSIEEIMRTARKKGASVDSKESILTAFNEYLVTKGVPNV